jgi:hypothetical protein
VPDDTAMVQLLDRIGARWERRVAVFQPIGKAHSHDHAGDHTHDHANDHSHAHTHEHPHGD